MREHDWRKDGKIPGRLVCQRCGLVQRMYFGDAEQEKNPREYYFLGDGVMTRTEVDYMSCEEAAMRRVLG